LIQPLTEKRVRELRESWPWSMGVLPDGRVIVTDCRGNEVPLLDMCQFIVAVTRANTRSG
jgi:hypothetical protein